MSYEELIAQLCEVIKESENNAQLIYDNLESIEKVVDDSCEFPLHKKEKGTESGSLSLMTCVTIFLP